MVNHIIAVPFNLEADDSLNISIYFFFHFNFFREINVWNFMGIIREFTKKLSSHIYSEK